jgi:hypothetical protein
MRRLISPNKMLQNTDHSNDDQFHQNLIAVSILLTNIPEHAGMRLSASLQLVLRPQFYKTSVLNPDFSLRL